MHRRELLTRFVAVGAAVSTSSRAASTTARKRVAVLLFDREGAWLEFQDQLVAELAALGWSEGRNLELQWTFAEGDASRLPALAARIVAAAPEVVVVRGTPVTQAMARATQTIPIVTGVADPIGSGFIATHAKPGGNVTGISFAIQEASHKIVEVLRLLVPRLSHLVALWKTDRAPFLGELMRPLDAAARAAGLVTRSALVSDLESVQRALRAQHGTGRTAAFLSNLGALAVGDVAAATLQARMPAMFEDRKYVDAGGLASFRYTWGDQATRRTASQVDKLLRGETAAQIPFELPTRQEFVLNLGAARALGLAVPRSVLLRADEIVQ